MINELIKLATHLDKKGLHKEADYLDAVIKRAQVNILYIKVNVFEFGGRFRADISSVADTNEVIGSKGFEGTREEQLPLAKKHLDDLRTKYPNAEIKQGINPPLTPEMFGL